MPRSVVTTDAEKGFQTLPWFSTRKMFARNRELGRNVLRPAQISGSNYRLPNACLNSGPSVNTLHVPRQLVCLRRGVRDGRGCLQKKQLGLDPKNAFAHLQLGIAYYYLVSDAKKRWRNTKKQPSWILITSTVHHARALSLSRSTQSTCGAGGI
jgi:hypothetical protein